jgi:hypothetical protein
MVCMCVRVYESCNTSTYRSHKLKNCLVALYRVHHVTPVLRCAFYSSAEDDSDGGGRLAGVETNTQQQGEDERARLEREKRTRMEEASYALWFNSRVALVVETTSIPLRL